MRIWPDEQLKELIGRELGDFSVTAIEPLLGRSLGYSFDRNKYGTITYAGENAGTLIASTQVFKNKEIWGIDAYILRDRGDYDTSFVPTGAFEEGLIRSLNRYLKVAFEKLDYPDRVHVEAGMVNVQGFNLAMPNSFWEKFWGPMFEDVSVHSIINKNEPESITTALLKIFEAVFDAAGKVRPEGLYGFPNTQ